MISFTSSLFLYGLFFLLLPIIIHLFGIKRPVKEVFAPLPLIMKVKKRIIRKKRIHYLILLILRILFFAFIVFIFAGIYISHPVEEIKGRSGCLFIIDNSPSSEVVIEGKSILSRLISSIGYYADRYKKDCNKYKIIALADKSRIEMDYNEIKSALGDRIKTGQRPVTLQKDLREILISEDAGAYTRVVLFSDMYSHFTGDLDRSKDLLKLYNVEVADITLYEVSNAFVSHIKIDDTDKQSKKVIATLENGAEAPFYGSIALYDGDLFIEKRTINIPPLDRIDVSIDIPDKKEGFNGHFFRFIIEGDSFAYDNSEYYFYKERGGGKILLVNGEPSPDETRSEVFFFSKALYSYFGDSIRLYSVLEDMIPDTLQLYDIIVLANVSIIDPIKADILLRYIRDGGKVFISLGNRINIKEYNRLEFLPAEILEMADSNEGEYITVADDGFFEGLIDIFQGLKRVRLLKLFTLKPKTDSRIILKTNKDKGILLKRDIGRGMVFLYATSIDMDMNDFAIRKNYLPFVSILVSRMLENDGGKKLIYATAGEDISIKVNNCGSNKVIIGGKSNIVRDVYCSTDAFQSRVLRFKAPEESGFYDMSYDNLTAILVVNTDKNESILKRTDTSILKSLESINKKGIFSTSFLKDSQFSLVDIFFIIAGLVLLLEMYVMNRR